MKARIFDGIRQIDAARWDGVGDEAAGGAGGDPFSTHAVLAALEDARLPGVRMWYATLEDAAGRWVAAAPLSRVEIDGGRLSRGLFLTVITAARRLYPGFMRTAVMLCGAPLSVGNPPARIAREADRRAIMWELAGVLQEAADAHRAPWRAFKEFPERELPAAREALEPAGWILAPSEPNFGISLNWTGYGDYLRSLRSDYRYKIRKAARKLERAGIVVEVVPLLDGYDPAIHALYDAVVDRAATQLEHLTPVFFTAFGRAFGDAATLIRLLRDGRVVGWVAMLFAGGVAFDMFHGINYEENEKADLYFNQLAEAIRLAIARGARYLSMGQSTEIAKTRFGGKVVPLWVAMRHRNRAVHALLRAGRQQLFPAKAPPVRHVFREADSAEEEPPVTVSSGARSR